jgi:hypothetical protein
MSKEENNFEENNYLEEHSSLGGRSDHESLETVSLKDEIDSPNSSYIEEP